MGRRSASEDQAEDVAPLQGYRGPGAGSYARRRKGREAEHYDRPALEAGLDGGRGQASHRRGKPRAEQEVAQ